jgi:glycosyltransferase involved in cell wall biosynthesis
MRETREAAAGALRATCLMSDDTTRSSPPQVLVVHPAMAPYRVDLFNALARELDLRVIFFSGLPPYDPHLDQAELESDLACDYEVLPRRAATRARMLYGEITGSRQSAFRPDVVVTHEFGGASVLASLIRSAGGRAAHVVWTTRNALQLRKMAGVRLLTARRLARRADAMLVYSDPAKRELTEVARAGAEKIFVCANHQSRERLRALARSGAEAVRRRCETLGIAHSRLVVSVGRCVESKGMADVVEAFVAAFGLRSDVAFIAIGEGPMRRRLQEVADDSVARGRIFFIGQANSAETQAWLSAASLNVLASVSEPYGAVVGEGLAHGIPCVCSSGAGAATSIVRPEGGDVFPPGDVSLLASLMKTRVEMASAPASTRLIEERGDLRTARVEDDLNGFCAAVRFALTRRHGHGQIGDVACG